MIKEEKLTLIHDKQSRVILLEQLWRYKYCN